MTDHHIGQGQSPGVAGLLVHGGVERQAVRVPSVCWGVREAFQGERAGSTVPGQYPELDGPQRGPVLGQRQRVEQGGSGRLGDADESVDRLKSSAD